MKKPATKSFKNTARNKQVCRHYVLSASEKRGAADNSCRCRGKGMMSKNNEAIQEIAVELLNSGWGRNSDGTLTKVYVEGRKQLPVEFARHAAMRVGVDMVDPTDENLTAIVTAWQSHYSEWITAQKVAQENESIREMLRNRGKSEAEIDEFLS